MTIHVLWPLAVRSLPQRRPRRAALLGAYSCRGSLQLFRSPRKFKRRGMGRYCNSSKKCNRDDRIHESTTGIYLESLLALRGDKQSGPCASFLVTDNRYTRETLDVTCRKIVLSDSTLKI